MLLGRHPLVPTTNIALSFPTHNSSGSNPWNQSCEEFLSLDILSRKVSLYVAVGILAIVLIMLSGRLLHYGS